MSILGGLPRRELPTSLKKLLKGYNTAQTRQKIHWKMKSDRKLKKILWWARNHGMITTKRKNCSEDWPQTASHAEACVGHARAELCQAHEGASWGVLLKQLSGVWLPDLAAPWLLGEKEMAQGKSKSHRKEGMEIDYPIPEISDGRCNTIWKIKTREIIIRCVNYIIN